MPEIPEMKHYKQLLSEAIIGSQIKQVTIQRAKSLNVEAKEFESLLLGEIIDDVSRRAKYLILHLHGGRFLT
ncbi:MAG: DNA-formamidopyrimidine glycosylase family protein [Carboxydocellales bacterium]